LLDFGLASSAGGTVIQARTPDYAPPEQFEDRPVHLRTDQRSDLYSLAATIYYLLTGRPPRRPDRGSQHGQPPIEFPKRVPPALRDLLTQMLAVHPDARPASAHDCLQTLREISGNVRELDQDDPNAITQDELAQTPTAPAHDLEQETYRHSTYSSITPARLYGRVSDLCISPDGAELAVASALGLARYRLADGQELAFTARSTPIKRAIYAAADRSILIADPYRLQLMDAHSLPSHRSMRWFTLDSTRTIAVAARGNKLIELSERNVVLQTIDPQRYVEDFPAASAAAITADGDRLALANNAQVVIHSLSDRSQTTRLPAAAGPVVVMAFSDNGQLLAVATTTSVALWDLAGQQQVFIVNRLIGPIVDIALSANGAALAIATDTSVTLYVTGQQGAPATPVEGSPGGIFRVAFSPDGQVLAGCASTGAWIWRADTGQLRYAITDRYLDSVQCLAIGAHGKYLASLGGTLRLWRIHENAITLLRDLGTFDRARNGLAFDPTARYLAAATGEGIWICDLSANMRIDKISAIDGVDQAHGVMFADNGATLLSVSAAGIARHQVDRIFTNILNDGTRPLDPIVPSVSDIYNVVFALGGGLLAAYNGSRVEVLRSDGEPICQIETDRDIHDVAISADGSLLVIVANDRVEMWSLTPEPQRIDAKPTGARLVIFSPDARQIALIDLTDGARVDGQIPILLYRLADGRLDDPHMLTMHNEDVTDVAFLPGSEALFSTGKDGAIRLWRYDQAQP
jgi:WD40 repeat protein